MLGLLIKGFVALMALMVVGSILLVGCALETVAKAYDKPVINYAAMGTRELRPMARDRKIPHWKKLNKAQLIEALSAV